LPSSGRSSGFKGSGVAAAVTETNRSPSFGRSRAASVCAKAKRGASAKHRPSSIAVRRPIRRATHWNSRSTAPPRRSYSVSTILGSSPPRKRGSRVLPLDSRFRENDKLARYVASWSPIGRRRMRFPVAAKMALHKAGAKGGSPGSPTPLDGTSIPLGTMWTCVIGGDSSMRTTW